MPEHLQAAINRVVNDTRHEDPTRTSAMSDEEIIAEVQASLHHGDVERLETERLIDRVTASAHHDVLFAGGVREDVYPDES